MQLEAQHYKHIIIIIIIVVVVVSFMQDIYTYIPETNYVRRECSVSAILSLLFMMSISLVTALLLLLLLFLSFFLSFFLSLNSSTYSIQVQRFIVSLDYIHRHTHTWQNSSGPEIGPSQTLLPVQHTIFTRDKYPAPGGIRTRNPADLRLRPCGHRDRLKTFVTLVKVTNIIY